MNNIAKLAETLKKIKQLDRSKMSEDQIASINAILESVGKQVQDRKTGEWYDPEVKFKELQNSPDFVAQMKRMAPGDTSEKDPDVAEAGEDAFINNLKGLQEWNVTIMNNFYSGKYPDYSARHYSVVAGSPEEARQVVLNNADYVLKDLLSRKLQSGKRVLPAQSALPIEDKRVGSAKPGSLTTMGFKKMLTPDGVKSLKFAAGKIVDSEEQGVDEAGLKFNGGYPEVDHMHGSRGINLPSAPTKKFFTDKKQWERAVNDINSSKYDDNSEYTGMTGRSTVSIDGREWARWSDAQQKGYIELNSMSEQGVAEGYDDEEHPIRDDGNEGIPGKQRYPGKLKTKGVAEAVAETMTMDQAKKVLSHYGADNFKTTSNELHFYKNGKPMSVGLTLGNDGIRHVSLSSLNSATRQLKGQGVAEAGYGKATGRAAWDSNMPGYQGDYGGEANWDSGRKEFRRHEADQEWEREQEYTRQREEEQARIAHYNETGKFWLKYKDSQKHVDTTPYTGKAAANAAALELLKQSPELKDNLVITARGPAEESMGEGYTVMPKMDDKYQDRQGLEGPFRTKSGKVVYYDKVEGKYYDPDTDFYIEYDDWKAMNERSISTTDESLRSRMHKIFSIRDYKG